MFEYIIIPHLYKEKLEPIKAEEYLSKSLDLNPNFIKTYDDLFSLYDQSNQIEKFSNLLDKAKKILSVKDLVSFYEAVFTYNQKNFKQTIQILENIDLKENYVAHNITKHSLLAKSYDRTNDFEKAYNHFKINNLKGVNHRLEWVKKTKGVDFYNDSKATNVNATITALKSFDKKNIFLIAGGESKNQILKPLEKYLKKMVPSLYLIGQDADLFEENFNVIGSLMISKHESMKDAVLAAYQDAIAGDIVLLSPACASYDMYKNYKERGNQFKSVVEKL